MSQQLLDAPVSVPSIARVVPADEGTSVRAFGNEIRFKLTAEQSGGAVSVGLATVPPGGGPPLHVHAREDELFMILEGTYRVCVAGEWRDAGPGSLVWLPRGVAHTFRVVGDVPGKHWVVTTPGGFDEFYAKCAEIFAASGQPDRARLEALNEQYGNRLV